MKCETCGTPLPENAKFCLECGTQVPPAAPDQSSSNDALDGDRQESQNQELLKQEPEDEGTKETNPPSSLGSDETAPPDQLYSPPSSPAFSSLPASAPPIPPSGYPVEDQRFATPFESPIAKKKSKMPFLIAGIVIVAIVLIAVGLSVGSPKEPAVGLDSSVSVNGLTVNFPSGWEEKAAFTDNSPEAKYLYPDFEGLVYIDAYSGLLGDVTASQRDTLVDSFIDGTGATLLEKVQKYSLDENVAYKARIDVEIEGTRYKGFILLVCAGKDLDMCIAAVNEGENEAHLQIMERIIEGATISVPEVVSEHTVTFKDGDTIIDTVTVSDSGSGATAETPNNVTKEGYQLEGWKVESGSLATEVKRSDGGSFAVSHIIDDVVLSAQWAAVWTVVFTDGEGNELSTVSVKDGAAAKAPADPKRDGYTFEGWDADCSKVTSDMTVNATWKAKPTTSQTNAVKKAKDYLKYTSFSYEGLVDQLEYEKFSHDDAVYGVDNCGADWNEQAAKKAASFLDYTSFSRDGLIDQLLFEGFTYDQAVYGVDTTGL